jgi:tetratricopeptide (TPR) repeat protein
MQWMLAFAGAVTVGVTLMVLPAATRQGVLTPDTIVAHLGSSKQVYSDVLRAALQTQRAAPQDQAKAVAAAKLLIDEGRAKGDSRLVGAALAVLRPFMDGPATEPLFLAATARQYQHDFTGSLGLLDQVIALSPRDVNALLNRATIHTVQGNYPTALQDCDRIRAAGREDVAFLCAVTAQTLTTDAPGYANRLSQIMAQPGVLDAGLQPWGQSLLAEIAMLQGDTPQAEALLTQLLANDPAAQREQLMLADIMLGMGRRAEVLALLAEAPDTDGVLIRRVLAGDDAARDILATRAQRSLDLGLTSHAREEAMYYLRIADDPAQALERAQANWALQHEFDDAQLLILAADAAGNPAAAQPVLDWMKVANVAIPALTIPDAVGRFR